MNPEMEPYVPVITRGELPPPRRWRWLVWSLLALVILLGLAGGGVLWWKWQESLRRMRPIPPGLYTLVIPRGSTARIVAELIQQEGMVERAEDLLALMTEQMPAAA